MSSSASSCEQPTLKPASVPSAGLVTAVIEVDGSVEQVFNYLADFSTTERWDPGVVKGVRDQSGPLEVGNTFTLTTVFKGRESQMSYTLTELDKEQHKIVLEGQSWLVRGVDTIYVLPGAAPTGKTVVNYRLDLGFRGILWPFIGWISADLENIGVEAMAGLQKTCAELFATEA